MRIQQYLTCILSGQIPPEPPDGLSYNGWSDLFQEPDLYMQYVLARDACIRQGLYTVIDQKWTKILADWIGGRSVLEVMAGAGFLAKALADQGIEVTATDNFSWQKKHTDMTLIYDVQKMGAVQAAQKIKADILLVSWPPYNDETIITVCDAWGTERPIIYIGELDGGCTAPEAFFGRFQPLDDIPYIPMTAWDGIHDRVLIGRWTDGVGP